VTECDPADREVLAAVIAGIPAERPLTAVVHAAPAATADPTDLAWLDRAMAAAGNADELTRHLDLDAFVLFTTAAGVFGDGGGGAYDAFADALARHRRASGLPALHVAWGPVAGGGTGPAAGLRELRSGPAMTVLEKARDEPYPSVIVADPDWGALRARHPAGFLAELPEAAPAVREDADADRPSLRLDGVPAAERERILLDFVVAEAAAVLGHDSPDGVAAEHNFLELGFSSFTALELSNRIQAAAGLTVPPAALYDHPTPLALVRHVLAELLPANGTPR
jgi:acyl carrier protein